MWRSYWKTSDFWEKQNQTATVAESVFAFLCVCMLTYMLIITAQLQESAIVWVTFKHVSPYHYKGSD